MPLVRLAVVAILTTGTALAQEEELRPPTDARLASFVEEALQRLPEIRQGLALVSAEGERVPQAGALPDPTLSLSIVNDSFDELMIGEAETSYYQAMYSQELPWPGKRRLRTAAAEGGVDIASARLQRLRMTAEADVRRTYVDLVLARDRLALLAKDELLWNEGEVIAKLRYEVGEVPQSDLIRAQLERTRLRQRRIALEANVQLREHEMNRLLGRELGLPVETPWYLAELPNARLQPLEVVLADAETRSPELLEARLNAKRATVLVDLAKKERLPDMSFDAGVMPRDGLDPMWTLGFSIGLPAWADRKQDRFVAETEFRREADLQGIEAVRELLLLRMYHRNTLLAAALETSRLYESGLLVQSKGATESTLSQYRVGRVPFTAVLEALAGYVSDRAAQIEAEALAQRLAIAQWELSLTPLDEAASAMAAAPGDGGPTNASDGSVTESSGRM